MVDCGVSLLGWLVAAVFLYSAVPYSREQFGERQLPFMGVMAAFVFAAQAINFPNAGGDIGPHLGRSLDRNSHWTVNWAFAMTAVITVQGFLFQDGGLLAMGWNILNLGAGSVLTGYAAYFLLLRVFPERSGIRPLAGFIAAFRTVW